MEKSRFKKKFKKLIVWFVLLFLVLFVFRLIYGYTEVPDGISSQTHFLESISDVKKNYASKEYYNEKSNTTAPSVAVDQKYEKIAEIKTKSSTFEKEEKLTRDKIEKFNALIQFEQKRGNKGSRKLDLLIGVPPKNFDSLYIQLTKIGKIQAKQITKKDKTNEYKELNAKKQSLEKIRSSLIELKLKGGRIQEYMDLENRILQIEQELQGLGVSLGNFDDENEFCTVQFSLIEGKEVKIGILKRIKVALEWTVKLYLKVIFILCVLSLFSYLILNAIDKFKILEKRISKKE